VLLSVGACVGSFVLGAIAQRVWTYCCGAQSQAKDVASEPFLPSALEPKSEYGALDGVAAALQRPSEKISVAINVRDKASESGSATANFVTSAEDSLTKRIDASPVKAGAKILFALRVVRSTFPLSWKSFLEFFNEHDISLHDCQDVNDCGRTFPKQNTPAPSAVMVFHSRHGERIDYDEIASRIVEMKIEPAQSVFLCLVNNGRPVLLPSRGDYPRWFALCDRHQALHASVVSFAIEPPVLAMPVGFYRGVISVCLSALTRESQ